MKHIDAYADPLMRRTMPAQPDLWANNEDAPEPEPENICPATTRQCERDCADLCAMWAANKPALLPATPETTAPPASKVYQAARFRRDGGSFIMEFTDEAGARRQVAAPFAMLED